MEIIDSSGFVQFLKDNNILVTVVATIISSCVTELSESMVNDLILPIINRDSDGDGEADIKDLATYEYKVKGIKFKVGKFLMIAIKFMIILFATYQISKILKNKI